MGNRNTKRASGLIWENLNTEAKRMRRIPTPAEKALWERLRNRNVLGLKFRRQHPIDRFIVDFCCPELRLVVEVDGPIHDFSKEEDTQRQKRLEELNMSIIRFPNERVFKNIDSVIGDIETILRELKLNRS